MKPARIFQQYIWLVNKLSQYKRLSLEELNNLWLKDEVIGGSPLNRNSFIRHKDAILNMFGIIIECDREHGYKYYIANPEVLKDDAIERWMLSTLTVNTVLSDSSSLSDRILLEYVPAGEQYLQTIIQALKINRRLVMDGPTLDLTARSIVLLIYNGMVVKAGSACYLTFLTLHWNNTYLNVDGGYVNVSSRLQYRRSGSAIRVSDGGFLSASALQTAGDAADPRLAVTVNGGLMTIGTTKIVSGCSLTFNGGEYCFRGETTIDDDVPIAFNGGTNSFYTALTDPTLLRRPSTTTSRSRSTAARTRSTRP